MRAFATHPAGAGLVCAFADGASVDPPPDGGYPNQNTLRVRMRSSASPLASPTQPLAFPPSIATPRQLQHRRTVMRRSTTTLPASYNTATGALASLSTHRNSNTANGLRPSIPNTGTANTAIGDIALFRTTTAPTTRPAVLEPRLLLHYWQQNVATGSSALL